MPALQEQHGAHDAPPPFRLDVQLHDLLKKSPAPRPILVPGRQAEKFPEPVFPQHPELMAQDDNYEENLERAGAGKRHWPAPLVYRAMNGWLFPYFKSRLLPGQFHPIIAYLFTEWKCNLDCHCCWAFDNTVKGMTEVVAKDQSTGCTRPPAAFWPLWEASHCCGRNWSTRLLTMPPRKASGIYMPTNARLLRPDVIDRLADAGVAIFNFAVDAVDEKPGLPKALNPIRKYFDYLIRKQYKYGYAVFFNINICRNNVAIILRM